MADVSVTLDLQARQLYEDLQRVQSNFAGFAANVTSHGEKAAAGFTGGFRGRLAGLGSALSSTLGTLGIGFGVGATVSAFENILEKAHEIHHESERFGIDAEQLQIIGIAAKEDGVELGQVARAMNLLKINSASAAEDGSKVADVLARLGVNADAYDKASLVEKFYLLGDAYRNSAKSGQDYADVATLIGKRNTEMIPVLLKSRQEMEQLAKGAIIAKGDLNTLGEAYKTQKEFQAEFGKSTATLAAKLIDLFNATGNAALAVNKALYGDEAAIKAAAEGAFVPGGAPGESNMFRGRGAGSEWAAPPETPSGPAINPFDIYATSLKAGVSPEDVLLATKYATSQGFTDTTGINIAQAASLQRQMEAQNAINAQVTGAQEPIGVEAESIRAGELEKQFQMDLSEQSLQISNWEAGQQLLEQIRDNISSIGANQ